MSTTRRAAPTQVQRRGKNAAPAADKPELNTASEAAPVVEQPVAEAVTAATPAPEQTPTAANNTHTSAARVRFYIDKKIMNHTINCESNRMRNEIAAMVTATSALANGYVTVTTPESTSDDGVVTPASSANVPLSAEQRERFQADINRVAPFENEYTLKIEALRHERVRFSSEASAVLSTVCDEMISELVNHAIKSALEDKKKIIRVAHVHEPGIEKLSLYPLVCALPSFVENANIYAAEQKSREFDALRKQIRNEVWKEFRTRFNQSIARKKKDAGLVLPIKVPEDQADVVEDADAEDTDATTHADGKTTFVFYLMQECKSIIGGNPAYTGVRFSTGIKRYLSSLIIEFIRRVSTLVGHSSQGALTRKTVNGAAILRTVEKLLIDGKQPLETISYASAVVKCPKTKEQEVTKRKEQKKLGVDYKIDHEKLPDVQGFVATKNVSYPDSGYGKLLAAVEARKAAVSS